MIKLLYFTAFLLSSLSLFAEEKYLVLDPIPRHHGMLTVAPDGSRIYIAADNYLAFDAAGTLLDQIGVPQGSSPRRLIPLPDGWFISITSYAGGHIALCRPDGTEAKSLVGKGAKEDQIRSDMTGWTSPLSGAVDAEHQRIFVLDVTVAPRDDRNLPNPDWSRIAIFDLEGKYIGDLNRYDASAPDAKEKDGRRTWYRDIAVDPQRQRVYVGAVASRELLAFDYGGNEVGRVSAPFSGENGAVAVFPDGRVAAGQSKEITILGPDLQPVRTVPVPAELQQSGILGLASDAAGRLYATFNNPAVTFVRWSPNLDHADIIGPRYVRLNVDWPENTATAGQALSLKVNVTGRPPPAAGTPWQMLARPADGRNLRWQSLPAQFTEGTLQATLPEDLRGFYEVAVRYGAGPIARADLGADPSLTRVFAFLPPGATRSLAAFTADGRHAYRQGEPIPIHIVRRSDTTNAPPVVVRVELSREDTALVSSEYTVDERLALSMPPAITRRLAPGSYRLTARAAGHELWPWSIDVASVEDDSPMQRLMYHEFGGFIYDALNQLVGSAEQMAYIRDWSAAAERLGFTRETTRNVTVGDWRRDAAPANLSAPGFPPAEALDFPQGNWATAYYLDTAVRHGLRLDAQLLGHCAAVRCSPASLAELGQQLQQLAQRYDSFPSFYGFNYNDELFVNSPWGGLQQSDKDWYEKMKKEKFAGRPEGELKEYVTSQMYDAFNAAVRAADPSAKVTATPMWQYPAVEGSYPPSIYRGMDESYSHFLSEGYSVPWNPAHGADILRRPGRPLRGVFDNQYDKTHSGERYLKNVMQVLARGVQGVGAEHTAPFADFKGASAYRVANHLARDYGPIFAECPPANEAAILYSRTQDFTEKRNMFGTPQWERVFELDSAGLMAGVPMQIVYEEDVAQDILLKVRNPKYPMLFLVGLTNALPEPVRAGLERYTKVGGRIFIDADSADFPGATRLPLHLHELRTLWHDGYAADSTHPLFQPVLERQAAALRELVGAYRRFPMDTDDPWVSKNHFDGGAIQYVMLARETSPYPWEAGLVWSSGAMYSKAAYAWLPKMVTLTLPATKGVIYDVFEHQLARPAASTKTATTLRVDLTTFPGRLYAVAPAPLGSPQLKASVRGDTIQYQVQIADQRRKRIAARVPLRVRLASGAEVILELCRGTDARGTFSAEIPLPLNRPADGDFQLEVTELLGGEGSSVTISVPSSAEPRFFVKRPQIDLLRELQLKALLATGKTTGSMHLATGRPETLTDEQRSALTAALAQQGIALSPLPDPGQITNGVCLAIGSVTGPGQPLGDLLGRARANGQLPQTVTANIPGPGRGFLTAVHAPRAAGEDAIVLVGGDAEGVAKAVDAFLSWLRGQQTAAAEPATGGVTTHLSRPVHQTFDRVPLRDQVGVRLSGVYAARDGKHLVVTADGYLRNVALALDEGGTARILKTERVGCAGEVHSAFVSPDGRLFGAAARTIARYGEGLHVIAASGQNQDVFAGFGDLGRTTHRFAISSDGKTVLAPGRYGVVAWRLDGNGWREAWAIDYWKEFPALDWPVSADAERIPQFHAVIPGGADYALVLFGELSNQGWVTPENHGRAWLAAVNLSDGRERWRFDVPVVKSLLFPTLHTSPNGSRFLLQVQRGSWGKESFRFFTVADGKELGAWDAKVEPVAVAVADNTGHIAAAFDNRLVEVRAPDGTLLWNQFWARQPVSLAFAADGKGLVLGDDAGMVTQLNENGQEQWRVDTGCVPEGLAVTAQRVIAAGWDGRLRGFEQNGTPAWTLDCTPAMHDADPMGMVATAARLDGAALHEPKRPSTTTDQVPTGANLLRNGQATLKVGGTPGWMSNGKVEVKAEDLTNGKTDDVTTPWLNLDEVFWDGQAGRQVWAEIEFKAPTRVKALTVHENPQHADSWPAEAVVQVWDQSAQKWQTAAFGAFLTGKVNTYQLDLKAVTKLRYVPWNSYYRNFYTSEIEAR